MIQKNKLNWPSEIFNKDFEYSYRLFLDETINQSGKVFPDKENLLNAFGFCSFDNLKVVIIGQDPYHGSGQANGLAFSVNRGVKIPPSLKNIFKEVQSCGFNVSFKHGDLKPWADQGVLLLNSGLSVIEGRPMSHKKLNWQKWTDFIVKYVSDNKESIVFMLWGNFAQSKKGLIDCSKHLVLEASHPSPLSARHSFVGCKHFSKANNFLNENINWSIY